ncbi:MAG: hypothetical protein P9X22_00580 [Candidatus Zapsychrus exili]|nr:hypothetical protein [Candidatus Zapsychrus exili]
MNTDQSYLQRYKKFLREYASRHYYLIINRRIKGERLLGQRSINLLLHILQRSRYLSESLAMCFNHKHQSVAYLAVRAHFEVTGMLVYFYNKIKRFYEKDITYEEMDVVLRRLTLGGRASAQKLLPSFSKAISVMDFIDEADRLFNSMAKEKKDIYRDRYDYLSEFCHPNNFGLTLGCNIVGWNGRTFAKTQVLEKRDKKELIRDFNISSILFFSIYDKCFEIIKERESKDMPLLFKSFTAFNWALIKFKLGAKDKAFERAN